jgi:hypothetical protein
MYVRRTDFDLQARDYALVERTLERMKGVDGTNPQPYAIEAHMRTAQNDWQGAWKAAQRYEELDGPPTPGTTFPAGWALDQLRHREEALEVLRHPIFDTCGTVTAPAEVSACSRARDLRRSLDPFEVAAPRKRVAFTGDPSQEQIQSDLFFVLFDGESQSGVARDVLSVLDRAYTRLGDVYYDRPADRIPVVLYSDKDYFSKTGAPWWSGGFFGSHTGSIHIPIRGMPSSLPREMEDVLVHSRLRR